MNTKDLVETQEPMRRTVYREGPVVIVEVYQEEEEVANLDVE